MKDGRSNGLGLATVLTIVFVVLKLTHVIAWSWWLVFLPLLISAGLAVVVLVVIVLITIYVASKEK